MNPLEITVKLQSALKDAGFVSSIISAEHVSELRNTIGMGVASGLVAEGVCRQYASYFDKVSAQDTSWARSVIAVAAPRPALEVVFTIDGEKRSTIIPPTYEHSIDDTLFALIEREIVPYGYRLNQAILPQKLLAARSGLARYGKNNITYVNGLGSFYRLVSFYTDLPAVNDTWQEPQVLEECVKCEACTKKCPTGAIARDRFQVHAERCLTFYNESTDEFPSWIDNSWHHCLVGCMNCQHFCPVNKNVRSWTEPFAELTEEESALLLRGTATSQLPSSLVAKFRYTDLLDDPVGLARNLRSVFAKNV